MSGIAGLGYGPTPSAGLPGRAGSFATGQISPDPGPFRNYLPSDASAGASSGANGRSANEGVGGAGPGGSPDPDGRSSPPGTVGADALALLLGMIPPDMQKDCADKLAGNCTLGSALPANGKSASEGVLGAGPGASGDGTDGSGPNIVGGSGALLENPTPAGAGTSGSGQTTNATSSTSGSSDRSASEGRMGSGPSPDPSGGNDIVTPVGIPGSSYSTSIGQVGSDAYRTLWALIDPATISNVRNPGS